MSRRGAATAAVALTALALTATAAASATGPVLGSRDYVQNGEGFGTAHPSTIFNGGVPSGLVRKIRWRGWGRPAARGAGLTSIYRPGGGYFGSSVRIVLRATGLGHCPGQPGRAYRTLRFRAPQWPGGPLGPWLKWSGSRTLCNYADTDPRYEYPRRPPGLCGRTGPEDSPGEVFDIEAFRLSCARARRVARAVGNRPAGCFAKGCWTRAAGIRCRLDRIHAGETTSSVYSGYPAQRVACRRGHGTMSAWLAVPYD